MTLVMMIKKSVSTVNGSALLSRLLLSFLVLNRKEKVNRFSSTSILKKAKNVYWRLKKGGKSTAQVKDCPSISKSKKMTLHPQVHTQHLMTRAEMKNMVKKKQVKVMMPMLTVLESMVVLMVVKCPQPRIEIKGVKRQMNMLNLNLRVQGPLMRAPHLPICNGLHSIWACTCLQWPH